jgi:hypothetical protein
VKAECPDLETIEWKYRFFTAQHGGHTSSVKLSSFNVFRPSLCRQFREWHADRFADKWHGARRAGLTSST